MNKSGEEATEKEYKKKGQVKHVVKKLYSGNAEGYLKCKNQLYHVFKNRPYEYPKGQARYVRIHAVWWPVVVVETVEVVWGGEGDQVNF